MYNIFETVLFVSLGVLFVLISFLVYHFKTRLAVMEQKHDTLLEIVNNVVATTRYRFFGGNMGPGPGNEPGPGPGPGPVSTGPDPVTMVQTRILVSDDEDDGEEDSEYDDDAEWDDEDEDEDEDEDIPLLIVESDDPVLPCLPDEDLDVVDLETKAPEVGEGDRKTEWAKLPVKALRDLAVSTGLVADASKLKKAEILALL